MFALRCGVYLGPCLIAVRTVGRYVEFGNAGQVSKLGATFDGRADSQLVDPVTRLAESALIRGCKLGPVVPDLSTRSGRHWSETARPVVRSR